MHKKKKEARSRKCSRIKLICNAACDFHSWHKVIVVCWCLRLGDIPKTRHRVRSANLSHISTLMYHPAMMLARAFHSPPLKCPFLVRHGPKRIEEIKSFICTRSEELLDPDFGV